MIYPIRYLKYNFLTIIFIEKQKKKEKRKQYWFLYITIFIYFSLSRNFDLSVSRLVELPDGKHNLHLRYFKEFNHMVQNFIAEPAHKLWRSHFSDRWVISDKISDIVYAEWCLIFLCKSLLASCWVQRCFQTFESVQTSPDIWVILENVRHILCQNNSLFPSQLLDICWV